MDRLMRLALTILFLLGLPAAAAELLGLAAAAACVIGLTALILIVLRSQTGHPILTDRAGPLFAGHALMPLQHIFGVGLESAHAGSHLGAPASPRIPDSLPREGAEPRQREAAIERRTSSPNSLADPLANGWRLEAQHRITQEVFRVTVEACQTGLVLVDVSGKIVLVNAAVEALFGYSRGELVGHDIDMLLPAELHCRHAHHREAFCKDPSVRTVHNRDLCGQHRDGSSIDVAIGLNPIKTREGVLTLCAILDIRARKRIERLKDEFVATVSHELRTPLTSIAAALDLLSEIADADRSDAAKELIAIAQTNSQRLVRLVNDILDIEKLEGGKVVFDMQHVDIGSLLERAVEANRPMAERCGVRLRLEGPSVHDVHADPDRLMQVASNLLSNAVKFSPSGTEVVVATEERWDKVRIAVRDHGHGIPEEFRDRIFGRFAQADNSDTRQKAGTGLGLSIVKQIVQRLGGEVGFADAPGGGTVFFVDLPRLQEVGAGEAKDAGEPRESDIGAAGHSASPPTPLAPELVKVGHG
jgi:PAS domain S-box-containing protein